MTVDCYREEFKALIAPLKDAFEEVLIGAFKNGLQLDICANHHLFRAGSLTEVMGLAQHIEEKNFLMSKTRENAPRYQRMGKRSLWVQPKSSWAKPMGHGDPT